MCPTSRSKQHCSTRLLRWPCTTARPSCARPRLGKRALQCANHAVQLLDIKIDAIELQSRKKRRQHQQDAGAASELDKFAATKSPAIALAALQGAHISSHIPIHIQRDAVLRRVVLCQNLGPRASSQLSAHVLRTAPQLLTDAPSPYDEPACAAALFRLVHALPLSLSPAVVVSLGTVVHVLRLGCSARHPAVAAACAEALVGCDALLHPRQPSLRRTASHADPSPTEPAPPATILPKHAVPALIAAVEPVAPTATVVGAAVPQPAPPAPPAPPVEISGFQAKRRSRIERAVHAADGLQPS